MRLARGLERLAALAVQRPRTTLGVAVAVTALAVAAAVLHLPLRTSNLDLIDPQLPPVARFRAFAEEFGTPNLLIVVLAGTDPARLAATTDRLGPRLAAVPGTRGVIYRLPIAGLLAAQLGLEPHFTSRDRGLYFLFVQPDDPYSRAETLAPLVLAVRQVLAEEIPPGQDATAGGIRAGLTGMPAYALDDREIIQRDISRLSTLSLLLVFALFATAFGALRRPLLAMVALLLGVGSALGVAALYPGHLTLLSGFFGSILFGLGVDYGIHLVDRVEELVAEGMPEGQALVAAVSALGRGLLTSALTTAAMLAALMVSGFRGFEELGFIAAAGILLCLLAMVTVLPALLVLWPPRPRRECPLASRRLGRLLTSLQSPGLAALLIAAALAGFLPGSPSFDTDYLNLQPAGSEAVQLERAMVARSDWSPLFAAFTAPSRQDAAELVARLRQDETVAQVHSLLDLETLALLTGSRPDPGLTASFLSPAGRWAVYAYPREDVWQPQAQTTFLAHMQAIDPQVTGMPVLGRFMVERSQRALAVTAACGVPLLLLCVLADFRRLDLTLLAILPTLLTVPSMAGLMWLLGLPLNPLNVMALPVVLGIAVDDGVHLVHRFLAERGDLARTLAGSGRSVVLTSATTLAAFVTLALTSHRGLASFAIALSLGVTVALVLSVLVLPQLLRVHARRLLAG